MSFYAVHRGTVPGVYDTWEECKQAVAGSRHPRHRKFTNKQDAYEYVVTGVIPKHADHGQVTAGTKRSAAVMEERGSDPVFRPRGVKNEPIDLTLDDNVVPEQMDVIYVHGYGWSKDQGEGVKPFAGIAVWWGSRDTRNISERCPGDQSIHHASLVALLRALETVPRGTRPFQLVSGSKYATECINTWLPRWRMNDFNANKRDPLKHEALVRCISALLDERHHIGQAVCIVYNPAAEDSAARSTKTLAKRGAQHALVPPRDYDLLAAAARARITGAPVPIARPFEPSRPAPHTPYKKRRVEAPAHAPALAPAHAALAAAMYSPRKMAILAQAAAILAMPPIPHPVFAAAPIIAAAPPPPVWAARPVVRSKVPRPGRPKTASRAPPPPPIRAALTTSHALNADFSPYASMLREHGVKPERP